MDRLFCIGVGNLFNLKENAVIDSLHTITLSSTALTRHIIKQFSSNYRVFSSYHPEDGNASKMNCLRLTVPFKGGDTDKYRICPYLYIQSPPADVFLENLPPPSKKTRQNKKQQTK